MRGPRFRAVIKDRAVKFLERIPGHRSKAAWVHQLVAEWARQGYGDVQHDAAADMLVCNRQHLVSRHPLAAHHAHYLRQPWLARRQAVQQAVQQMLAERDVQLNPAPDVSMLRPVIRDRAYGWFRDAQLDDAQRQSETLVRGPLIGRDHQVYLALDHPTHLGLLTHRQLQGMGLDVTQALILAGDNLRRISGPQWRSIGPDALEGAWADGYDCSRLLLPDVINELGLPGRPVAITPVRGKLLVTSDRSVAGQRAVLETALQSMSDYTRWNSPHMLVLDNAALWQPYKPAVPPILALQQRLAVLIEQCHYQQQQPILVRHLQNLGQPIEVADYATYELDEQVMSVAVWTKGRQQFLPRAQHLALIDPAQPDGSHTVVVPWDVAFDYLAPDLVPVSGVVPPRYHVTAFPDDEVLQSLRAHQLAA